MKDHDRIGIPAHAPPSLVNLPSPSTKRWVAKRKAMVVAAVRNGVLSLQEACRQYNLSVEKFLAWERSIERYGVPGLKGTRLQVYRATDARFAKQQARDLKR
jgi:hypothetical protein